MRGDFRHDVPEETNGQEQNAQFLAKAVSPGKGASHLRKDESVEVKNEDVIECKGNVVLRSRLAVTSRVTSPSPYVPARDPQGACS